jgi:hypothetical protein
MLSSPASIADDQDMPDMKNLLAMRPESTSGTAMPLRHPGRLYRGSLVDPEKSGHIAGDPIIPAGAPAYACPECKGKGSVTLFTSISPCRTCSGRGVFKFKIEPLALSPADIKIEPIVFSPDDIDYAKGMAREFDSFFASCMLPASTFSAAAKAQSAR